jgi:hypothetical protein
VTTETKVLVAIIAFVGLLGIAVGIIYFTLDAYQLPNVLGHIRGGHFHRTKRGAAGLIIGGVLLLISILVAYFSRRSPRQEL